MTNEKRLGKVLYLTTGIAYLLSLVLPTLRIFNDGTTWVTRLSIKITSVSLGRLILQPELQNNFWDYAYLILTVLHIPLIILAMVFLTLNYRNEDKYIAKREQIKKDREEYQQVLEKSTEQPHWFKLYMRTFKYKIKYLFANPIKLAFFLSFLGLWGLMAYRDKLALSAYDNYGVGNKYGVIYYHIGFYTLLIGVVLNYFLTKVKTDYSKEQLKDHYGKASSSVKHVVFSPLGVQYFTMHMIALILMIVSYGMYAGWGKAIQGPSYYLELMLTHGLNHAGEVHILLRIFSWVFAPMFVLFLGVPLFFLRTSGYAPNGVGPAITAPPEEKYGRIDYQYDMWAYFSRPVPLSDNYVEFLGYKANFFYLGLVFGSIFGGIIISSFINYFLFPDRTVNIKHFMILVMSIALFIGWEMAVLIAPVVFSPTNIVFSTFVDRLDNFVIMYKLDEVGGYHPLSTFWIIVLYWLVIVIFSVFFSRLIRKLFRGSFFKTKEHEQLVGRKKSQSKAKVPFVK